MNTYSYRIDDVVYINLTNKCSNACEFCVRVTDSYKEYSLWLESEPTVQDVINSLDKVDVDSAKEVVFCGYGEPTYKLEIMLELCDYFHSIGKKTRLNTNGQGSLIMGYNIAEKFKGKLDTVSISLNATDAKKYQELCHSEFGESSFYALIDFAKECKKYVPYVKFSIVDVIGEEEIKKSKEIADAVGVELRVREFIE